ncbi:MAG: hypothetical protein LBV02_06650, partial [Bacteroidales bacterium]|nr:hypothetical protein [Bacteroidales bacterium]
MKKIYFFFFTLLIIFHSQAQEIHPADSSRKLLGPFMLWSRNELLRNVYDPERGYFQKAFTDKDDPRFMITNEDETFKFGIGGFVNVLAFMDFDGMVEFPDFVTSQIPVPMGKERGQFGLGAANSRINFKVVGKAKKQTIVGFIETDFRGTGNALRLRHAYISYFGFTVGQTWSTFMDLEAGPPTIDQEGPNTQIATRQPMIRYSGNFTPKFSFSVALEMNTPLIFDYSSFGIQTEYPHLPDIPAILKFKDKFGHVQLAGIVRAMNYYDDTLSHSSITEWGYGGAISGKFNLPGKFYIYYQAVAGKGI